VLIAIMVFFFGLLVVVWVVSEQVDPKVLEPPTSLQGLGGGAPEGEDSDGRGND
jgi:hypothetical protein